MKRQRVKYSHVGGYEKWITDEVEEQPIDNDEQMHAILHEYGFATVYPPKAEKQAQQLDDNISEQEILRRKDMRGITTFTIDPEDAKDFDDALSIRTIEGDKVNYEVGVHIADVTFYVKPDTELDKEAYQRATSVYLVDRTVPMLPERLSNQICSLRPNEDKLCFSVIFLLDEDAHILKYNIKKTIIRSCRRFTYEQAQERLDTAQGDYNEELLILNNLAQKLRQRRFRQGSINFEREETRFRLDDDGKPVEVYFKEPTPANNLIEEFMLLANRTVAEAMSNNIFVYRIHDVPDPDKMSDFTLFIRRFGYNMKGMDKKEKTATKLNKLLAEVKGRPEQNIVENLCMRTMAKAVYSTDNIGHYGLAFRYYTHFTSPIRRYPDIMVHRLLEQYMKKGKGVFIDKKILEDKCLHCSDQERQAAEAERASVKYKQVEFMKDQVGQVFDGVICSVTEWGVYVELKDNHCEGLLPIRELDRGEFFFFNEKEYCLEGEYTGKRYTLGDRLQVKVTRADLIKRQLDFTLA